MTARPEERPRPLGSLVASAKRIANARVKRSHAESWQDEAWCVDEETEILTADGWRRHDEVDVGTMVYTLDHDTGLAGWEPVEAVERFDVVDEPMLSVEMRHHSSLTTMAHRWPVLRQTYDNTRRDSGRSSRAGRERAWTMSRDLYAEDQFVTAAPARDLPSEAKWSDAFVEIVAWFWTEGSIRPDRTNPSIRISQSVSTNPANVTRIRRALTALYGPELDGSHEGRTRDVAGWRQTPSRDDMAVFTLNVAAAEQVLAVAPDKVVDVAFLRELTEAQLRLFIDVSCLADGHDNGYPARLVRQRDRDRIDPLPVACVLAGITPHVWYSETADMWEASLIPRTTASPRRKSRRETTYTGTVWCPVTPSGSWLARRDGTVWFTGNSAYDEVGELRFVANTLSNSVSMGRLFAARLPAGDEEPDPVHPDADDATQADRVAAETVHTIGGGALGRAELLRRLGIQLFVPGDGYLVGLPPGVFEGEEPDEQPDGLAEASPTDGEVALSDLTWHALSVGEVGFRGGKIVLRVDDDERTVDADQAMLIRCWRPHPRKWWTADSPVKANLPVIRELIGLTKHVSATIDSRLAGAGLLVLPSSVEVVGSATEDTEDAGEEGGDDFVTALIDTMTTPIQDRDSASAVVPLTIKVPDDVAKDIDQGNFIKFSTPFDTGTKDLRDEAIRRLALGLDAPPEVLQGLSGANHWCHDTETEILTRRGWLGEADVAIGDEALSLDHETGTAEWQPVTDVYRADVVDEPMRSLQSRTHSSVTTLAHRWPTVAPWGTRRWRSSAELSATDGIPTAAPVADLPTVPKYDDAYVEAVAWFWTEGSVGSSVTIAQSHTANPGNVDRVRAALTHAFGRSAFTEAVQANDSSHGGPITVFRLRAEAGDALLAAAPGKQPTAAFVDALTLAQLHLFVDVSCMADGHHWSTGERDVWQRDPAALDAYERACVLAGYAVSRQPSHDGGTVVRALRSGRVVPVKAAEQAARGGTAGATDEVVSYTGRVWCPTVPPHHTVLARRRGRTFYTGQSAWQIQESTVRIYVAPTLALICDALTTEYLWPVLEEAGVEGARDYVVWFDTDDLTLRPNRSAEAQALYDKGELSGGALRRESGFDDTDAPERVDRPTEIALALVQTNPELMNTPGLPALITELRNAIEGTEGDPAVVTEPDGGEPTGSGMELPETEGEPPEADQPEPVAAGLAASLTVPSGNGQT